ncbi:hypothetical protein [Streptomyces aureus]|uniref:hypothetical protein n=1 Tax=Streptomyces aureus TaxID=193461 RepID=UPI000569DF43|nr:hypothetical protein [Streptomyces aureus]
MNRVRLYLHRIFRRPVITGPYRLYVRRIPGGAMLDVEHYLTAMIEALADDSDLLGLLDDIVTDRAEARAHDGWKPEALLVEKLTDRLGFELPLYDQAAARLADRLHALTPAPAVVIPGQREGEATA